MSSNHLLIPRPHWRRVRLKVLDRDDYKCCTCGRRGRRLEVDHIVPMDQGGAPLAMENLQTLCVDCHIVKTAAENLRFPVEGQAEWYSAVASRRPIVAKAS
ncbi:MAG: HNH endonuclease [Rhodospirillaceae bacterium]|nr:HNH endonuclease [Rhodospirillaceae bacterium]